MAEGHFDEIMKKKTTIENLECTIQNVKRHFLVVYDVSSAVASILDISSSLGLQAVLNNAELSGGDEQ